MRRQGLIGFLGGCLAAGMLVGAGRSYAQDLESARRLEAAAHLNMARQGKGITPDSSYALGLITTVVAENERDSKLRRQQEARDADRKPLSPLELGYRSFTCRKISSASHIELRIEHSICENYGQKQFQADKENVTFVFLTWDHIGAVLGYQLYRNGEPYGPPVNQTGSNLRRDFQMHLEYEYLPVGDYVGVFSINGTPVTAEKVFVR